MRFSLQERIQLLIEKDLLETATKKLIAFTQNKEDYAEIHSDLQNLLGQLNRLQKPSNGNTDQEQANVSRNRISRQLSEINNDIKELKETRDKKYIWSIAWKVLTGLLIPVLAIFIPHWIGKHDDCPKFDKKPCKVLIMKFPMKNENTYVETKISDAISQNQDYFNIISSGIYQGDGSFDGQAVKSKCAECKANFGIYGTVEQNQAGQFNLDINTWPRVSELPDSLNIDDNTIPMLQAANSIINNKYYTTLLQVLVCRFCDITTEMKDTIIHKILLSTNDIEGTQNRAAIKKVIGFMLYENQMLDIADTLFSALIIESSEEFTSFAYRGKIRAEQQKYEEAFFDYYQYLDHVPANFVVRKNRFYAAYNFLSLPENKAKISKYLPLLNEDLGLLKGKLHPAEWSRLKDLYDILNNMRPTEPEKCTITGRIHDLKNNQIGGAEITINQQATKSNGNGIFTFNLPCNQLDGAYYTVNATGYQPTRGLIEKNVYTLDIALQQQRPTKSDSCYLSGRIVTTAGKPIYKAAITINESITVYSDEIGLFRLPGLLCAQISSYKYQVKAKGYLTATGSLDPQNSHLIIKLNPSKKTKFPFTQINQKVIMDKPEISLITNSGNTIKIKVESGTWKVNRTVFTPYSGAEIFINNISIGKTSSSGLLESRISIPLNETIFINVKGIYGIPKPSLPYKTKFTKSGQEVLIQFSPVPIN